MAKINLSFLTAAKNFILQKKNSFKKPSYATSIEIDATHSAFHFYTMTSGDRATAVHTVKNFTGPLFDQEFFNKFKLAVKEFVTDNPAEGIRKVTVILPDVAVLTDTVKLPTMRGFGQTKKNLSMALGGLYQNIADLRVVSYEAMQNRQYTVYSVLAVQEYIISSIYAACSENRLLVDTLTLASGAAVCGATVLNAKLKGASYLFLDVKDTASAFAFVANGKMTGYYTLPFGYEFLQKQKVTAEDMLFDHSHAELAVLNAKERAKSKKLTVMALDTPSDDEDLDAEESADFADAKRAEDAVALAVSQPAEADSEEEQAPVPEIGVSQKPAKIFARKSPRKLPKFMQRPHPETEEEILYENFRVFVKWALTLIASNEKLTEIGKPEFVCVNMPLALASILDKVNEEQSENGIPFLRLSVEESAASVTEILSLFGGLFPKHMTAGKL